jgi:predicted  nucleic acid-binding Zn-ribbon protein
MTQKRNRRTRVEMLAALQEKLDRLKAQVSGTYDPTNDEGTYIVQRIRRAIRRRNTAMGNANTLLNGRPATDRSPAVAPVGEKIANAEHRIAELRKAQNRATEILSNVPGDIERLEALLKRAESGDEVEMPNDLYMLPSDEDRTSAEVEASAGGVGQED